jgi:hypothetical protein
MRTDAPPTPGLQAGVMDLETSRPSGAGIWLFRHGHHLADTSAQRPRDTDHRSLERIEAPALKRKSIWRSTLCDGMPWPALKFVNASSSPPEKYSGRGIPRLVVIDLQGKVLSHRYKGEEYLGPSKVIEGLEGLLAAE